MRKALAGVALALWLAPAAHAAAPSRILYLSDWSGWPEVFAVDPAGKAPIAQITHWHGRCSLPAVYFAARDIVPSPDGRHLLVSCNAALWLMRADGADARALVTPRSRGPNGGGIDGTPVWSRDSKRFAYRIGGTVHVVTASSGEEHEAGIGELRRLGWSAAGLVSPDHRWIASAADTTVTLFRATDSATVASLPGALAVAWSPDSRRLALESRDGIRVYDVRARRLRMLTNDAGFGDPASRYEHALGLAWAPDSRRLVYVPGKETLNGGAGWGIVTGDLHTIGLTGRSRTIVASSRAYGGRIAAVAWTKMTRGLRYGAPEPAPRERVASNGILAAGKIDLLAADGGRVAFEACDTIVVWTPSAGSVDPPNLDSCGYADLGGHYFIYDLALAGDRLAYALNVGCMSITLTLHLQLVPTRDDRVIAVGRGHCGGPFGGVGRMAGSGDLLVYNEWTEQSSAVPAGSFHYPTTTASVRRVDGSGCPCPVVASTGGPLYPADVDGGRIVVYGDNETLVLDRDGERLLSLPVSPLAAQLDGMHLILVTPGRLRDCDVRDGAMLHAWPLPDVPSGPLCAWRTCDPNRLVLADAAHGLVAYISDDELHVRRLADGAVATVGRASLARFMDAGLVYADGARLRLVTFSQLPLRGF